MFFVLFVVSINFFTTNSAVISVNDVNYSNCTCVPYFQCSEETGTIITSGAGLFDKRTGIWKNAQCTGYYDVCCNNTADLKETSPAPEEKPKGCGYHSSTVFPWSILLRHQKSGSEQFRQKCGASLINKNVAITAAHCVSDSGLYDIKIGTQSSTIVQIIKHSKFDFDTLQNDIAILILNSSIELNDEVSIVCIPSPRFKIDKNRCITSSWSDSEDNDGSNFFRKILILPIISKKNCEDVLRSTRLGPYFQLHRSFICAGGEMEKDTCNGDGGNPLMCPISGDRGRFHQVGIVSWGIGCGEFNVPAVYVNLGIFRDWIDKVMLKYGYSINEYRY